MFFLKCVQILNSSDIIDLKYKNKIATLSIKEVYPEDEGEYVCKATNSLGVAQTKCKLTVKCKEEDKGNFWFFVL